MQKCISARWSAPWVEPWTPFFGPSAAPFMADEGGPTITFSEALNYAQFHLTLAAIRRSVSSFILFPYYTGRKIAADVLDEALGRCGLRSSVVAVRMSRDGSFAEVVWRRP